MRKAEDQIIAKYLDIRWFTLYYLNLESGLSMITCAASVYFVTDMAEI